MGKRFYRQDGPDGRKNPASSKKLVGLVMTGRGIARHGYKVLYGAEQIGIITSGHFRPTLNKAIGLASINIAYSAPDTETAIAIREQ